MERRLPKEAILSLYLNIVEFGPGITGIGAASEAWFLKDTAQLSPREAAFLASLLPAPRMWHAKLVAGESMPRRQIDEVLGRMARRGDLSEAQFKAAKKEQLRVVPPKTK
jgi:membrane peptidoglycan carboxypeptidase